jgi:hypothetical protein
MKQRLRARKMAWQMEVGVSAEKTMSGAVGRSEREEELIEMAVCLLEHMRWSNDAYFRAKEDPKNDALYCAAHDLSENLETVRRCLADAIIDVRLDLNDRVRAVCPFPAYMHSSGSIGINNAR